MKAKRAEDGVTVYPCSREHEHEYRTLAVLCDTAGRHRPETDKASEDVERRVRCRACGSVTESGDGYCIEDVASREQARDRSARR